MGQGHTTQCLYTKIHTTDQKWQEYKYKFPFHPVFQSEHTLFPLCVINSPTFTHTLPLPGPEPGHRKSAGLIEPVAEQDWGGGEWWWGWWGGVQLSRPGSPEHTYTKYTVGLDRLVGTMGPPWVVWILKAWVKMQHMQTDSSAHAPLHLKANLNIETTPEGFCGDRFLFLFPAAYWDLRWISPRRSHCSMHANIEALSHTHMQTLQPTLSGKFFPNSTLEGQWGFSNVTELLFEGKF